MLIRIAAVVCLAAMLSGCGGVSSPSQNTSQDFTGTVTSGQSTSATPGVGPVHTFSVGNVGEFSATFTAIAPDQNIYLGVLYGQPANGVCNYIQTNNAAHLNAQALGGQIQKGSFCVQVFDVGYVSTTTPTTYTLRVSHP
jgi:hypothetical protein